MMNEYGAEVEWHRRGGNRSTRTAMCPREESLCRSQSCIEVSRIETGPPR